MKKQQIQQQEQMTAYDKKVTHDMFLIVMEWLEKYVEIVYKNEFPDWENRKQIKDNKVVRPISGPEDAEECFSVVLLGFVGTMKTKPDFIRKEVKNSFYEWIDATGKYAAGLLLIKRLPTEKQLRGLARRTINAS